MTDSKTVSLGGRTFEVPPFPLGVMCQAYPVCRKLHIAGVADRFFKAIREDAPIISIEVDPEELADLAEFAFLSTTACKEPPTREEFFALSVTPAELLNALITLRTQTGVWIDRPADAADAEKDNAKGEAGGAKRPRK